MADHMYQRFKNVYHFWQAHFWRLVYGWPERNLSLYAVTGTNGKTTTSYLLAAILRAHLGDDRVGLLSTIAFWVGTHEQVNETKMTTLASRQVYSLLARMRRAGVTHAVVEVTSHALDQRRLAGLYFDAGIFLGISREHLDYHGSMVRYAAAKAWLLRVIKPGGIVVGKADNQYVQGILADARRAGYPVVEFTRSSAATFQTPLPGSFNQENTAAASLLAQSLGVPLETIEQAVAAVRQVPGRMEWVTAAEGGSSTRQHRRRLPRVLVDYAVTPDALQAVYQEVRQSLEASHGKLFAVLGAAGQRDRGKRPAMARAAAAYADELVLTREDPWTEDEEQIFWDLEKGLADPPSGPVAAHPGGRAPRRAARGSIAKAPLLSDEKFAGRKRARWRRIQDRREAIAWCLRVAGPDDVVVVTGKGAETGMAIGTQIVPWSDQGVIQELLQAKADGTL